MGPLHPYRTAKERPIAGQSEPGGGGVRTQNQKNLNCCWLTFQQEKRKKSNLLSNGLVEGEEVEESGGHGGPELQRTGRCGLRNAFFNFPSYLLFVV